MMSPADDESDDETLLRHSEPETKPKETWDLFEELPPDKDTDLDEDRTVYNFILRVLKFLTYIVTFTIVIGCSVISKSTTLLMTSQLRKYNETIPYCNPQFGENLEFLSKTSAVERISWVWALFFCFILPEVQSFLRALRIMVFKGQERPTILQFCLPFIFETLHTIGMALLIYLVFPTMDAVKAAMLTNAVCIVPGVLAMLSRGYDTQWVLRNVIDVIAILLQLTVLFVWPLFAPQKADDHPWLIPFSVVLVSFGWWENFVEKSSPFTIIKKLGLMKNKLRRTRYFTYLFISIWKIIVFLGMLIVCTKVNEGSWTIAFDKFTASFNTLNITVLEKRPPIDDINQQPDESYLEPGSYLEENVKTAVLYVMGTQMLSAYLCYIIGKLACRICIQTFSYSFPTLLSVPTTLTVLVSLCGVRHTQVCFWDSIFPGYLWWTCPQGEFWKDYFVHEHTWVWVLWLLSQTWITIHIWIPKKRTIRLPRTEMVFSTPLYNAFLVDQTLALNRRRDDDQVDNDVDDDEDENEESEDVVDRERMMDIEGRRHSRTGFQFEGTAFTEILEEDYIPKIYACATMWHETKEEMIEMLKSVFRMDADQCARKIAKVELDYDDPAYYEYETHIFFDDAFVRIDKDDLYSPVTINSFVRDFISQMEEAASHVHQTFVKLRRPKKIPTPYGGRLEWLLPGRTKLICHIKNKDKIRHKKRWSQVMYMYYLLGYKLTYREDLALERKEVIAENTFILALDGDIDYQPKAVELLVDLMKKNRNLGAACGRIHPIGSGPMVWYQRFEYAVGHWFQKATEHVFGCVLCSPGCFSLFRAKALMDYNVMRRYTTMATEPRHYVQYDQGEDRWLCTLLLQRGWRVEYSAASDAKTHAPEGFREFFNQRRRWVPSTMANIMDLLLNGKRTVKQNPDISYPYIGYHIFLMVGSILGPGTIFLMMVGAFAVAFKLDQWTSFLYNFIPILLFILVCFFLKSDLQLLFAEILTTIYALAMVAVVVAIILQISDDGLLAPSTLFLMIVAGSFIIAGLAHPLEFGCLPHGFIYYITIPSMYLLLIIYSLFNLNNVSWGTREVPQQKTTQELEAEQKEAEKMAEAQKKQKKGGLLGGFIPGLSRGDGGGRDDSSIQFSCAGLFKLMCCVKEKPDELKAKLDGIALVLADVTKKMETIERSVDRQTSFTRRLSITAVSSPGGMLDTLTEENEDERAAMLAAPASNASDQTDSEATKVLERKIKRDDLMNPVWMEDKDLNKFKVDFLTGPEKTFWELMIAKYLVPIDEDKKALEVMTGRLKDLRNKVAFTFIMCNAVFVILIFLLQLEKSTVHINWPFGAKVNVTYRPQSTEVQVSFDYLELEPIGLIFVAVFGVVLLIQFIGMLYHRLGTFLHIMALTVLFYFNNDSKSSSNESTNLKDGIGLIRKLQKARIADYEKDKQRAARRTVDPGRRHTVANLLSTKTNSEHEPHDLHKNFKSNITDIDVDQQGRKSSKLFQSEKNRRQIKAMKERRSTVFGRRPSTFQGLDNRRQSSIGGIVAGVTDDRNSLTPSIGSSSGMGNRFIRRSNSRLGASGGGSRPGILSRSSSVQEEIEMSEKNT